MNETKKTGDPRKDLGWFSRRYETRERHDSAYVHWELEKNKLTKAQRVTELTAARAERSPFQQMEELDRRLGFGAGAFKERVRLAVLILS